MARIWLIQEGRKHYFYDDDKREVCYVIEDYQSDFFKIKSVSIVRQATVNIFGYILIRPLTRIVFFKEAAVLLRLAYVVGILTIAGTISFWITKKYLEKQQKTINRLDENVYVEVFPETILIKSKKLFDDVDRIIFWIILGIAILGMIAGVFGNTIFLLLGILLASLTGIIVDLVYGGHYIKTTKQKISGKTTRQLLKKLKKEGVF